MYPYAQLQTISNGICELRTEDQPVLQGNRIDLCILTLNYRQLVMVFVNYAQKVNLSYKETG